MAIADDGVQNLLPAKHFCLEQLQSTRACVKNNTLHTRTAISVGVLFRFFSHLVVSLLLQQTLVVARDLSGQLLISLRQKVHPGLTLLEEALLLEQDGLQFTGEGQRKVAHTTE